MLYMPKKLFSQLIYILEKLECKKNHHNLKNYKNIVEKKPVQTLGPSDLNKKLISINFVKIFDFCINNYFK